MNRRPLVEKRVLMVNEAQREALLALGWDVEMIDRLTVATVMIPVPRSGVTPGGIVWRG